RPVSVHTRPENSPSTRAGTRHSPRQTKAQTLTSDSASAADRPPRIARRIPSPAGEARHWLRTPIPALRPPGPATRVPVARRYILRSLAARWNTALPSRSDPPASPNRSPAPASSPAQRPGPPPRAPALQSEFPPNRSTVRILPPANSGGKRQTEDPVPRRAHPGLSQNSGETRSP